MSDGGRALELVRCIQDALQDSSPHVAALGLDALGRLCEDDAVDFYTAWRVVAGIHPRLPK